MDVDAFVEQAKGIIVGRRGCSIAEAEQMLARLAATTDRSLSEAAKLLVDLETRSQAHDLLDDLQPAG